MTSTKLKNRQCGWIGGMLMLCFLFTIPHPVSADKKPSRQALIEYAKQSLRREYAWFNAPWTDSDRPYARLRHQIEQKFARSQKPVDILKKYKTMVAQHPTDPQAVFAYGYAAYTIANIPDAINSWDASQELGDFYLAWEKVSAPHTYNYARLLFLTDSNAVTDPNLVAVGKRLAARNPNDYDVEYYLAVALNLSNNISERTQAITYQQDLARRFPNDPRQYRLLGLVHYITAFRTHSQSEAEQAIAAYQRYGSLSPSTEDTRSYVDSRVRFLRQLQARWKQEG